MTPATAEDNLDYERRLRYKRFLRLWGPLIVVWSVTAIGLARLAGLQQRDFTWFELVGGLVIGLALGSVMAWSETRGLSTNRIGAPPWVDLFGRTALYTGAIIAAILLARALLYYLFPEEVPADGPRTLGELWEDRRIRRFVILLFIASFALNFLLHLRLAVGPEHLAALFTGRYRQPAFQQRAFVFVDLVDSTPTAQALGPLEFTCFKHDFFSDIAEPLIVTGGRIVQYVGDEVMVTWHADDLSPGAEPFAFVATLESKLRRRAAAYETRYGRRPRFRTGIHYGEVVVAQVGDTRRDIVYSGDVVNTGARLLQACREQGVDGLASAVAVERFGRGTRAGQARRMHGLAPVSLSLKPLGTLALRGRAAGLEAYGWRWDGAQADLNPPSATP